MIELSLLRALAALADCGTLSAAAGQLHTSQPALSRAMKRLEDELGVTLFLRTKNHIGLSPTGAVAVDYARRVLQAAEDFTGQVRAFDRRQHTISIGYCAPVPQVVLTPIINNLFEGMTISADMKDDARFLDLLAEETYQLAVMHEAPADARFYAKDCGRETLYLSVPTDSPFAFYPRLTLADLGDASVLLFSRIGFWMRAVREKTPRTRYLLQVQRDAFLELANHTGFPCFSSSYFLRRGDTLPGRVNLPITDDAASTHYYLVCLRKNVGRFRPLFQQITEATIQ